MEGSDGRGRKRRTVKDRSLHLASLKYSLRNMHHISEPLVLFPHLMNVLPSPPLNSLSPPSDFTHYRSARHTDTPMKAILASTWHVLDQQPPPSLREILDAYKSKGDGDRDMLMAMLNAKSAEDQRLASIASLHRTMLDMYQTPLPPPSTFSSHVPEGHRSHHTTCSHARHFPSPPTSYSYSPHAQMQSQDDRPSQLRHRTDSSASAASQNRERNFTSTSSAHLSRKRRRTSRSPPPSRDHRTRAPLVPSQGTPSASAHDLPLPPSPYSSASSAQSSGGSPRSREAMMIGSLLSSNPHAQGSKDEDVPKRKISSERSTTTTSSRER